MFQTKIFVADDHDELERSLNEFFRDRKCLAPPNFLQLVGDGGEANYAVLVAWEE